MTPGQGEPPPAPPAPWSQARGLLAEVVPLGPPHEVANAVAAAHLNSIMGFTSRVVPGRDLPDQAYLAPRRQYDAERVTRRLAEDKPPHLLRMGITDMDLCLTTFTFVYGEASLGGWVAVVSLHRLRPGPDGQPADRPLLYQRLAKVVCHEAGHALGLIHCLEPKCLMRFAGDLGALDGQALAFCPACRRELAQIISQTSASQPD